MGFALLRDTLTIRELSFPALGLVLPTASPSALGTTVSKTPPTAAELPPGWFSQGCLLTLSWPIGISLRFPSLLWGNLKEDWRLEQLPCGILVLRAGFQQGKFLWIFWSLLYIWGLRHSCFSGALGGPSVLHYKPDLHKWLQDCCFLAFGFYRLSGSPIKCGRGRGETARK